MNRCRTCKWWEKEDDEGGACLHPKVEPREYPREQKDGAWYGYDEGGCIHTGPEFGCVHWETDDIAELTRLTPDEVAAARRKFGVEK